jgi:2-iminobutanoate/2-iminopropanoate deaminase
LRPQAQGGENHGMSILDKLQVSAEDAPSAIGPYSQAVRVGNLVYTSGQVALDPKTGQLVEGGVKEQTIRVLENLKAVLAAAATYATSLRPPSFSKAWAILRP